MRVAAERAAALAGALEQQRIAAASGFPLALTKFGWLFATSPQVGVRDGSSAVVFAERAAGATGRTNHLMLNTLAAAYAEAGRFADAVRVERAALGFAQDDKTKEDYGSRLRLYESNTPYRDVATNDLVPASDDRLGMAALLRARGTLCAQFSEWSLAVRDLTNAIALNPDEHWNWYVLAPLLLETGNVEGFRQHCHAMLARFGATNDPAMAERAAKVCLMAPTSIEELAEAAKLAETAVTLGKDHSWAAYFQFVKGLAEYRSGNFEKAAEWTKMALEQAGEVFTRDVQAYSVLALAQYRLNHADEARAALSKAGEIAEGKLAKRGSGDLGPDWHDWIIAQILLREARGLIEGSAAPAGSR